LVTDFEMFCSIDDETFRGSVRVDLTLPEQSGLGNIKGQDK